MLLALVTGIALYEPLQSRVSPVALGIAGSAAALLLIAVVVFKQGAKWRRFLFPVALFSAFLLLGFGSAQLADSSQKEGRILPAQKSKGVLLLRVAETPKEKPRTWQVKSIALKHIDPSGSTPLNEALLLYIFKDSLDFTIQKGDTLLLHADLQIIPTAQNPYGFEAQRFYRRRGIRYQQFAGRQDFKRVGETKAADQSFLDRLHQSALQQLHKSVADKDTRGLLEAMLLGEEANFDPELKRAYANTGIIHIVAISGSHLAMLFVFFSFIPLLVRGKRGRQIQYTVGFCAVWLYVLIAGAPPSAVRAAVVFSLVAGSVLLNVKNSTLNTLLVGVFAILLVRPFWIYEVGFQLSVTAVLSILLFYTPIRRWWTPTNWVLGEVWKVVAASLAAQILVTPVSIFYFHNFPLLFLFTNVLAWLLVGMAALFGGIGIILFSAFGGDAIALFLAKIVTGIVHFFNDSIRILQDLNPPAMQHLHLNLPMAIALYLFLIATAVAILRHSKQAFFTAGGALSFLLVLSSVQEWNALHNNQLVVYSASRYTLIDRQLGKWSHVVFHDTAAAELPAVKEARIGNTSWRQSKDSLLQPILLVGDKRVLILRTGGAFDSAARFPVDILVIARPLRGLSPARLQQTFSPKQLIAASPEKRYKLLAWTDSCRQLKQPFTTTLLDGAVVIP
jgi:competence protein ComEC